MRRRMICLPMYEPPSDAVDRFVQGLVRHLSAEGFEDLDVLVGCPADLMAHWTAPELLLSQTCGYPLTHALAGRVRLVATPVYDVPGCDGVRYSSLFLVRADDPAGSLADLAGRRVVYNSADSQSGYNALRAAIATLAGGKPFLRETIESGGHRRSMRFVQDGKADLAAVDCVTFALAAAESPSGIEGLRILGRSETAPGLPFVTSAGTSHTDLQRLRAALTAAVADPALGEACAAMRLGGLEILPLDAYDAILAMERRAVALSYPVLA